MRQGDGAVGMGIQADRRCQPSAIEPLLFKRCDFRIPSAIGLNKNVCISSTCFEEISSSSGGSSHIVLAARYPIDA